MVPSSQELEPGPLAVQGASAATCNPYSPRTPGKASLGPVHLLQLRGGPACPGARPPPPGDATWFGTKLQPCSAAPSPLSPVALTHPVSLDTPLLPRAAASPNFTPKGQIPPPPPGDLGPADTACLRARLLGGHRVDGAACWALAWPAGDGARSTGRGRKGPSVTEGLGGVFYRERLGRSPPPLLPPHTRRLLLTT